MSLELPLPVVLVVVLSDQTEFHKGFAGKQSQASAKTDHRSRAGQSGEKSLQ